MFSLPWKVLYKYLVLALVLNKAKTKTIPQDQDQDQDRMTQDQDQDQDLWPQDQDQDLQKVVLNGLKTKTWSWGSHPCRFLLGSARSISFSFFCDSKQTDIVFGFAYLWRHSVCTTCPGLMVMISFCFALAALIHWQPFYTNVAFRLLSSIELLQIWHNPI